MLLAKKIVKSNLSVIFICISSAWYIYEFFPAPFYIFFIFSICCVLHPSISKSFHLKYIEWLLIIFILIVFFVIRIYDSNYSVMSYYIFSFVCFYIIRGGLSGKSLTVKLTCSWLTLISSSLTMLIDTIYRLSSPNYDYIESVQAKGKSDLWFYGYKHSFIFQDSNFSALVSIFMICLSLLIWRHFNGKKMALFFVLLNTCLVFLSFSRAAIFATLCLYFIFFTWIVYRNSKPIFVLLVYMFIVAVSYTLMKLSLGWLDDDSYLTKIDIVIRYIEQVNNGDIFDILFGWGFDQTKYHWPRAAHNLFITLLLETGVVGFSVFCLFILNYAFRNFWSFLTFSSFFIATLSFGFLISAYTVPLSIIIILSEEV